MGNAAQVVSEMQAWALAKWAQTEGAIRTFASNAEQLMAEAAPEDTGNLKESIKADEQSLGVFNIEVKTYIEPNPNPITGWPASVYGFYQDRGHYNIYLHRSVPPKYFMENGSEAAYAELQGILAGIW